MSPDRFFQSELPSGDWTVYGEASMTQVGILLSHFNKYHSSANRETSPLKDSVCRSCLKLVGWIAISASIA